MEAFADVAKARASYKLFADAVNSGREIMRRAGVEDPPPIPEFDLVFKRLSAEARRDLYEGLENADLSGPAEAIRFWQPFIRRAFGVPKG